MTEKDQISLPGILPEADNINHPSHYNAGKIEVIEFIEDQGLGDGFRRGSAIKYIARAGKKDPKKEVEDLEKAIWYLRREVEIIRAAQEGREPLRPNDMNKKAEPAKLESKLCMLCMCPSVPVKMISLFGFWRDEHFGQKRVISFEPHESGQEFLKDKIHAGKQGCIQIEGL